MTTAILRLLGILVAILRGSVILVRAGARQWQQLVRTWIMLARWLTPAQSARLQAVATHWKAAGALALVHRATIRSVPPRLPG